MSIQHAFDFIRQVEDQPELKEAVTRAAVGQGLSEAVQIGSDRQLFFDEQELRRAFAIDWTMRVFAAASGSAAS